MRNRCGPTPRILQKKLTYLIARDAEAKGSLNFRWPLWPRSLALNMLIYSSGCMWLLLLGIAPAPALSQGRCAQSWLPWLVGHPKALKILIPHSLMPAYNTGAIAPMINVVLKPMICTVPSSTGVASLFTLVPRAALEGTLTRAASRT